MTFSKRWNVKLTKSFFSMAPRKSMRTGAEETADEIDAWETECFFPPLLWWVIVIIGGMEWNNFSGVLSEDEKEKSAESPRTLSRSLKKCDVDDEESWLTPECVGGGGSEQTMDDVVAGVSGLLSISGKDSEIRLTGERLRIGWSPL